MKQNRELDFWDNFQRFLTTCGTMAAELYVLVVNVTRHLSQPS